MDYNIFLYGSEDSGAINYFRHLFWEANQTSEQFRDLTHLINLIKEFNSISKIIILTGSAIGQRTLDKLAILESKKRGIKCYSVIEHWSWYRKRFATNNGLILPDKILLNDEISKMKAVQDGLPEEQLVVLGNPVLESLSKKNTRKIFSKKKTPYLRILVYHLIRKLSLLCLKT